MTALWSIEMSVTIYLLRYHIILEDLNLQQHFYENRKSFKILFIQKLKIWETNCRDDFACFKIFIIVFNIYIQNTKTFKMYVTLDSAVVWVGLILFFSLNVSTEKYIYRRGRAWYGLWLLNMCKTQVNMLMNLLPLRTGMYNSDNTTQQDFGTRKVYSVSNVTFHAESKYAINFLSPTVFVQWHFYYWFFGILGIFISDF
jgi:hypothetical protein